MQPVKTFRTDFSLWSFRRSDSMFPLLTQWTFLSLMNQMIQTQGKQTHAAIKKQTEQVQLLGLLQGGSLLNHTGYLLSTKPQGFETGLQEIQVSEAAKHSWETRSGMMIKWKWNQLQISVWHGTNRSPAGCVLTAVFGLWHLLGVPVLLSEHSI